MDLLGILISINKISIILFLITLIFLGYEVYLLLRERRPRQKPVIPNFDQNTQRKVQEVQFTRPEKGIIFAKSNSSFIFILLIILIVTGFFIMIGITKYDTQDKSAITPIQEVETKSSKGILLFDNEFKPLSEDALRSLTPGDTIIVGIDKVQGTDIDMARFLVNSEDWKDAIITDKYDMSHNMYYINYKLATDEAQLYVQAQLHSKTEGWLGN